MCFACKRRGTELQEQMLFRICLHTYCILTTTIDVFFFFKYIYILVKNILQEKRKRKLLLRAQRLETFQGCGTVRAVPSVECQVTIFLERNTKTRTNETN